MRAKKSLPENYRWLVKVLSMFIAAALLSALLPTRASAALRVQPEDCDRTYEVKRGDTLSAIGTKYGRTAAQIVAFNEWKKPYTIYVGQRICIPPEKKSDVPKVSAGAAGALAVYFTAGRAEGELLIYTYNYDTVLTVRVDDAGDSVREFTTVGSFDIADVGNRKTQRFRLPADLRNAGKLFICLKDKSTNYLQCVYPRSGP
jgi:hypothetical protein